MKLWLFLLVFAANVTVWAQSCEEVAQQDVQWIYQVCTAFPSTEVTFSADPPPANGYTGWCWVNDPSGKWLYEYVGIPNCDSVNPYPQFQTPLNKPKNKCGSIVQVENQVLGESIPLTAIDFNMNYFTSWSQGRVGDYAIAIPLAGSTPDSDISSYDISLLNGTTVLSSGNYPNTTANQTFSYTWNGQDTSGNLTLGRINLTLNNTVHHLAYDLPTNSTITVGNFKAKLIGLGGWLPSIYNFYDVTSTTLYKGDGSTRTVTAQNIPGGGYYIAETDTSVVYYFDSTGKQTTIKSGLLGTTLYTFNYDSNGRLSSVSEPFGNTVTFNRDSSGNFTSITAPKGQVTTVTLDSNGFVASFTNPNSETYSMSYSGTQGLLSSFTKPAGQVSTFTYDSSGNLTQDASASGYFFNLVNNLNAPVTDYNYSTTTRMGRQESYQGSFSIGQQSSTDTYSDHRQEYYSYSEYSGGGSENDSFNGYSMSKSFVADARFPTGQFVSYYGLGNNYVYPYVTSSQSVTLSDPTNPFSISAMSVTSTFGNQTITTAFDPTSNTFTTTTGLSRTYQTTIDSYERTTSVQRGTFTPISFTYTNEKLTGLQQGARTATFSYDATTGNLSSMTNPLSQTTGFTYDNAGRVTSQIFPDLRTVAYSYDSNGNMAGVTPPGRTIHSFTLNTDEQVTIYAPPTLPGITTVNTTYTYDNDKKLTQITKPTGDLISYAYDPTSGVLQTVTTPAGVYAYSMSSQNALPYNITMPSGAYTYIYYAGTVPKEFSTYGPSSAYISDFSLTYNSDGKIGSDTVTAGGGSTTSSISYSYDNDHFLNGAGDETFSLDTPNGALTGTSVGTSPNIVTDSITYNSFGEITGYQASYGSSAIYGLTLTRDNLGRITSKAETVNGTTTTFGYTFDSSGRLTQVTTNGATTATYGYDDNSNRNSGTIGAQTTTATYDAQDRMTAYNVNNYSYNANGELMSVTNTVTNTTTSYTYDVFGNLTSVTLPSGTVITYEIDGLNRRIGKWVNGTLQKRWVYMDQTRIAAELDASGNISKRFVYGSKGNIPDYFNDGTSDYRIITDQLGSPRLVVNVTSGAITETMSHDEFGQVTTDSNPGYLPFGFAGGLYDSDTGLVRFGARDYDPEIGRWTAKDPIRFGGGDTNLYGYVANDPINGFDPSGLSDINLFPPNQRIYGSDFNITTMPYNFSVGGHGNQNGMVGPNGAPLSASQVAQLIRSSPGYMGQPVQLNSCSTGGATRSGAPNFAQQLSNNLGVPVTAPDNILGIYTDGGLTVYGSGQWNVFHPSPVPFR